MNRTIPVLVTLFGASKVLGRNRAVVTRLLAEQKIVPAAFIDVGTTQRPLFAPEELMRAADFLRHSSAVPPALS